MDKRTAKNNEDYFTQEGTYAGEAFNAFVMAFLCTSAKSKNLEIFEAASTAFQTFYQYILDQRIQEGTEHGEKDRYVGYLAEKRPRV